MSRLTLLVAALVLAGCLDESATTRPAANTPSGRNVQAFTDSLPDGRWVRCYVYEGYEAGGIACIAEAP